MGVGVGIGVVTGVGNGDGNGVGSASVTLRALRTIAPLKWLTFRTLEVEHSRQSSEVRRNSCVLVKDVGHHGVFAPSSRHAVYLTLL